MRVFYSLVLYVLLPFILIRLVYRSIANPEYRRRIPERLGWFRSLPDPGGVWIHAVSVGEAVAAIKLVNALLKKYPQYAITVTCGTPTGSQIIQRQLGERVFHVYAPYDFPGAVKRFLDRVRPTVGILMETEIWPNIIHYASCNGVNMLISNMRLSEKSFGRYQKLPRLVAQSISKISLIAAQSETDANRAIALGADPANVYVVGNLKFEIEPRGDLENNDTGRIRALLGARSVVWLAGSTHPGEDELVLDVHGQLLANDSSLLLMLAPRHPERFEGVYQLSRKKFHTQKRSQLASKNLEENTRVLILDSIGELNHFIAMSDWAFIGGSLVPVGGHNILEACQASVPVIYGKYMSNFTQIAKLVHKYNAGFKVSDENQLLRKCQILLSDANTRESMGRNGIALMQSNQGALARALELLSGWLADTDESRRSVD